MGEPEKSSARIPSVESARMAQRKEIFSANDVAVVQRMEITKAISTIPVLRPAPLIVDINPGKLMLITLLSHGHIAILLHQSVDFQRLSPGWVTNQ